MYIYVYIQILFVFSVRIDNVELSIYLHKYSIPPAIREGYIPSPPANPEHPQIIDAVLNRLRIILHTPKYASKHIIKTVLFINTVIM